MNPQHLAQLRPAAAEPARRWVSFVPGKAWILLLLFLVAAVSMAVRTTVTAKDSSLHLKLQHGFRSAQVSLWVDQDLAYSGKVFGSVRKRFGLIPSDSAKGTLSEIIPVRSGRHTVRVRIEPDDAATQEDTISGSFSTNKESTLSVSARQNALLLSWIGTANAPTEVPARFGFSRYAGSLLLTPRRIDYVGAYRRCGPRVAWAAPLHVGPRAPEPWSAITLVPCPPVGRIPLSLLESQLLPLLRLDHSPARTSQANWQTGGC